MHKVVRGVVVMVIILASGYIGREILRERQLLRMENKAIQAFNAEEYREAIKTYEKLLSKMADKKNARRERVNHQLALAYKKLADTPEVPIFRSVEFYQKAAAYDESVVDDDRFRNLLQNELRLNPEAR